ncbi:Dephospho-CoA kinase [Quillaja saponaria]|uniref:Dephospho-CoA kinase n=1 Tax=Quillaja saponaria TaxID=32244 RepID=A0AAD7Q171_QUISA|nr:Dephospho-CoA kinase [Quillaja saponaria]
MAVTKVYGSTISIATMRVFACHYEKELEFEFVPVDMQLTDGMRIEGLAGGISSGKSTVSNLFKSHDFPVVDTDLVARDVLKKGTEKPQLFSRLLAPYISSGIFWEILKLWMKGFKVIVLDVPLLFEAKMFKWTKPIIVVWVDQETQIRLLVEIDRIGEEDARNRINAQMPMDLERSRADRVIDNSGSLDDLNGQFKNVLFEVSKPLTWTEFGLSRQGATSALVSVILGVLLCTKSCNSDGL